MMNNPGNSPVFTMMPEKDHIDITLIAVMDMMFKFMKTRNAGDKKRLYWLDAVHTKLMTMEERYQGSVPEWLGDRADGFNADVSRAMTRLTRVPTFVDRDAKGRFTRRG